MTSEAGQKSDSGKPVNRFATTHWSVVVAAGKRGDANGRAALAELCETYWYPLYVYVRRRGYNEVDAQDLTQGFFATLLEKDYLEDADRNRGRFRSFLITALKRYIGKQHQLQQAQKRGGNLKRFSLDFDSGENLYRNEPSHNETPEQVFERRWALTVLENALQRLQSIYDEKDNAAMFESMKIFLTGDHEGSYQQAADRHDMTQGAVKTAVHRLRVKYRELIRSEIADTVVDSNDIDDELRSLQASLRGKFD